MTDPMIHSTLRKHPDWHVRAGDPKARGGVSTTARGYLTEYERAIRDAKADAWDEGYTAGSTPFKEANPYRDGA